MSSANYLFLLLSAILVLLLLIGKTHAPDRLAVLWPSQTHSPQTPAAAAAAADAVDAARADAQTGRIFPQQAREVNQEQNFNGVAVYGVAVYTYPIAAQLTASLRRIVASMSTSLQANTTGNLNTHKQVNYVDSKCKITKQVMLLLKWKQVNGGIDAVPN